MWDLESGEFKPGSGFFQKVFNSDRSAFLYLDGESVRKFSSASGESELLFNFEKPPATKGGAGSLSATPDFEKVLIGFKRGQILIWQKSSQSFALMKIGVEETTVTALAISDDGGMLGIGTSNGQILTWEAGAKGPTADTGADGLNAVKTLKFLDASTMLAVRSKDVFVMDTSSGSKKQEYEPGSGTVALMSLSADGSHVAFAEDEGKKVAIHSTADGSLVEMIDVPDLRR